MVRGSFRRAFQFQNRLISKDIIKKNAVFTKGCAPVPALIGIS
jgi:hypothetical protein